MIPHGPNTPGWLFPGRVPGQPIDGHSLTNLLNRQGISTRPARNGALSALAADLPAAILADLLGLHVNTAVRWVTYARRDWTDYLAARAAEHGKPQQDDKLPIGGHKSAAGSSAVSQVGSRSSREF